MNDNTLTCGETTETPSVIEERLSVRDVNRARAGSRSLRSRLYSTKSVTNLILAVEVRCHKVHGITEAFFDSIILGKLICCLAREKAVFLLN